VPASKVARSWATEASWDTSRQWVLSLRTKSCILISCTQQSEECSPCTERESLASVHHCMLSTRSRQKARLAAAEADVITTRSNDGVMMVPCMLPSCSVRSTRPDHADQTLRYEECQSAFAQVSHIFGDHGGLHTGGYECV
jgi:hypothetical protein